SPEPGGDDAVGLRPVLHAYDIGGEAGIGAELGLLQHLAAQLYPFAIALDADEDRHVVCCLEYPVWRDGNVRETGALGRKAVLALQQWNGHPLGHAVEHGDADIGTAARPPSRNERFEDRLVGIHAGSDVDDGHTDTGRTFRSSRYGGKARLGLDQQVIGLAVRIRPAVAIARDRARDQPLMALR